MPKIFITPENQNDFYTVICKDFRRQKYIIMISWFIIQVVIHIFLPNFQLSGTSEAYFETNSGFALQSQESDFWTRIFPQCTHFQLGDQLEIRRYGRLICSHADLKAHAVPELVVVMGGTCIDCRWPISAVYRSGVALGCRVMRRPCAMHARIHRNSALKHGADSNVPRSICSNQYAYTTSTMLVS